MNHRCIGQEDMTATSDWFNTEHKLLLVRSVQGLVRTWVQMNKWAQTEMWELRDTPSQEKVIKWAGDILGFRQKR